MGKVMAALKARYAGQMDFAKASAAVKANVGLTRLLSRHTTPVIARLHRCLMQGLSRTAEGCVSKHGLTLRDGAFRASSG